jgi:hypothetical protein
MIPKEIVDQLIPVDKFLKGFNEAKGVTSIDAIVCPHCNDRVPAKPPFDAIPKTRVFCRKCRTKFGLKAVDSPQGRAWLTETTVCKKNPDQSESESPR